MVAFRLNPEALGQTRFAFSPIAEVGSALHLLAVPHVGSVNQRWIELARQATGDLDLGLLESLVSSCSWLPDFLYQPATSPETSFESQLQLVEQGGMAPIVSDLERVWSARPMPSVLADVIARGDAGLGRITDALWAFWQAAIEPYWPRICAVLEDDVAHRANRIVAGGLYELFGDLHPDTSVDGDYLHIHKPHHPDDTFTATHDLTLVPSVFTFPAVLVVHDQQGTLTLVYGARGVGRAWEGLQHPPAGPQDHLSDLIGRSRAAILTRLSVPMTTSELAQELDQSLGAVSEHLARLRAAGLLVSWRNGRRVYYRHTPLASTLVQARALGTDRRSVG